MEGTVMLDRSTALEMHVRGNLYPPLPLVYAVWAGELLDLIAEQGGVEFCDFDQRVKVPDAVMACGVVPRDRDADNTVRLGDMTESLHIYEMAESDDDDGSGDDETGATATVDHWTVDTADDARFYYRITIEHDTDPVPEEYDCYDVETTAAWHRNEWSFVVVTVTPVLRAGGVVFEYAAASLGAVEYGSLAGKTIGREQLVEYPVKELMAAARETAVAAVAKLLRAIDGA
jgi:hypothetical protein